MNDYNICEHCNLMHDVSLRECECCTQPLARESRGGIAVWRLDEIEDGVLGPVMKGLREFFGRPVVLQPSFLREEPSDREAEGWSGLSAGVLLNQVGRRHEVARGTFLSLGITERNIVSSADEKFLFGYGLIGGGHAVMSLKPLRRGCDAPNKLIRRAVKIATHELGHALGLAHHSYDEGVACTMVGDVEVDSVELLDRSTHKLCARCAKTARITG